MKRPALIGLLSTLAAAFIADGVNEMLAAPAGTATTVTFSKADLGEAFLLQTSYEQPGGWESFMTSRSRLVTFRRAGEAVEMVEKRPHEIQPYRVLATIPIRGETTHALSVDLNAGFSRIFKQEDRTGEDYYGRLDRDYYSSIRLSDRRLLEVSRNGRMLVVKQSGTDEDGSRIVVHYYLSPYHRNPDFEPFELHSLQHFGFYETYPRRQAGRTVLYAMKFDVHEPVVFALSAGIPPRYRHAVRDGVEYWNEALGAALLRVVDAPPAVTAPDPNYNVIQWVSGRRQATTSHIQSDPLTGEILHASVFIGSRIVQGDDRRKRSDHLRYVVAHEIGHALGLRHNLAKGPVSTVMNYFSFDKAARIGRDVIGSGGRALEYDRRVMRHVYLGQPLDLETLPAFCTDSQAGCDPFPTLSAAEATR